MVTATQEQPSGVGVQERARTLADYDQCQIPMGWHTVSLKQSRKEWNRNQSRLPRRFTARLPSGQLGVPVPTHAWEEIWKAITVFGLQNIYVSAPSDAFIARQKTDPLLTGRANGKTYFIAAWGLPD